MRRIGEKHHFRDISRGKRLAEHRAHRGVPVFEIVIGLVAEGCAHRFGVAAFRFGHVLRHEKTLCPAELVKPSVGIWHRPVQSRVRRAAADVVSENVQPQSVVAVKHFHRALRRFFRRVCPHILPIPRGGRAEAAEGLMPFREVDSRPVRDVSARPPHGQRKRRGGNQGKRRRKRGNHRIRRIFLLLSCFHFPTASDRPHTLSYLY